MNIVEIFTATYNIFNAKNFPIYGIAHSAFNIQANVLCTRERQNASLDSSPYVSKTSRDDDEDTVTYR